MNGEWKTVTISAAQLDPVTENKMLRTALETKDAALRQAREALEPFAGEADHYEPDESDGVCAAWASDFTIGSLRRARAALAAIDAALKARRGAAQ